MTTYPSIHFRTATPTDAPGIVRVLDAFGPGYGDSLRKKRAEQPHQWRVGLQGTEIVCALRAAPSELWVGQSRVKSADIGEVAVAAEYQGRGIGSQAMEDCDGWLRESGYALARLGGLMRFYSRFGYEPFPRCYIEFPISNCIRAGAARIDFVEMLKSSREIDGCVRPYDPDCDFKTVCELIDGFTRGQTGSRVFDAADEVPENFAGWMVYEDGAARIRGAMRCNQHEHDMTPFESMVMISGFAYETGNSAPLEALLKHALKLAHERGAKRMTAYLPQRDEVIADVEKTGLDFTVCSHKGAIAGNMVRVVGLNRLLESIRPELVARLAGSEGFAQLEFCLGVQKAGVRIEGSNVWVEAAGSGGTVLAFSHRNLMEALLGMTPHACDVSGSDRGFVDRMFPGRRGSYVT